MVDITCKETCEDGAPIGTGPARADAMEVWISIATGSTAVRVSVKTRKWLWSSRSTPITRLNAEETIT